jgi:DNA-binding LytR/AlgR family response regulator
MQEESPKIKCIAIDEDSPSLELLKGHINKIPFFELIGIFTNPFDAISFLNKNKTDLVFTDVEMTGINGIQLINTLKNKPMVIIVSEHNKYAIDGYSINALDFLLKPFSFEKLLKAANKAYDQFFNVMNYQHKNTNDVQPVSFNSIYIKSDYRILKLNLNEILFIEGFNDYVKIHTINSKPILSLLSLKNLDGKLPVMDFVRVHRSYIIAVDKIDIIEKKHIIINSHHIPISQTYNAYLYEIIEKKNLCFY